MTFGFALLTLGFVLVESGWRGATPLKVLQGLTTKGPGGVLAELGKGATESLTPPGVTGPVGTEGEYAPPGVTGPVGSAKFNGHPSNIKPGIKSILAIVQTKFPGLVVTATTDGTHASGSYHYKGRAVDITGSTTEMNTAAKWIAKNLTHALTEGIHNPGLSVKYKKAVPSSYWGSETWAEHADHIHLAV